MKILTILGARPQFIKAAAISRAICQFNEKKPGSIEEVLVHTGQHYDENMSAVFFDELEIQRPKYNLNVSAVTHAVMTARMLEGLENVLLDEKPDKVLVYGDTNSTLAGALSAAKLNIPVAHVEAGLRSFNKQMPEEINRIITDHISDLLFCPTAQAVKNLNNENIKKGVYHTGDVMYDIALLCRGNIENKIPLKRWDVNAGEYALCTIHRAENTDDKQRLENIISALSEIADKIPVILPIHPRTHGLIEKYTFGHLLNKLMVIDPVSYIEMLRLEMSAKVILTDSGGVQKEAYFNRVPCITMRDETEWVETVEMGWNRIVGADRQKIIEAWKNIDNQPRDVDSQPYGSGKAAGKIVKHLWGKNN